MFDILSRDGKTYPETVEAAREAAGRLKEALESKILGQTRSLVDRQFSRAVKARAVAVLPASNPPQISRSLLWSVKMEGIEGSDHGYSLSLTDFLHREEIDTLFEEHFRDVDTDYLTEEADGPKLRAGGRRIDITEDNEALMLEGRRQLKFHATHNSESPEVVELRAKVKENSLYLALIGAIYSSKGGDTISVPDDEMRVFAHRYMKFAELGGYYLLVECGDTVSLHGVIQNVRRAAGDALGSS